MFAVDFKAVNYRPLTEYVNRVDWGESDLIELK